jgi:hypothetical protein
MSETTRQHLSEAQLEELRVKYAKIGVVEFNGHTLVFRKPSREHVREYRRKKDSDAEKMDAMDQLAQATILAFDAETDPNKARTTFTGQFLDDYPLAISNPKFVALLSALAGLIEEEDAADLGKGVSVRGARQSTSPTASPNGSAPLSTART